MAARKTKTYAKTIGGSKPKSRTTGFTQKTKKKAVKRKTPVKSDGTLLEEKRKAQRRKAKPKKLNTAEKFEARVKDFAGSTKALDAFRRTVGKNAGFEIDADSQGLTLRFSPPGAASYGGELEVTAKSFAGLVKAATKRWKEHLRDNA